MIYAYGLFVEETKRHLNMATKFITLFKYIYQRIMRQSAIFGGLDFEIFTPGDVFTLGPLPQNVMLQGIRKQQKFKSKDNRNLNMIFSLM